MRDSIGRAFTVDQDWHVKTQDGRELPIAGGELGKAHPILSRGKDENSRVQFFESEGIAYEVQFLSFCEHCGHDLWWHTDDGCAECDSKLRNCPAVERRAAEKLRAKS